MIVISEADDQNNRDITAFYQTLIGKGRRERRMRDEPLAKIESTDLRGGFWHKHRGPLSADALV